MREDVKPTWLALELGQRIQRLFNLNAFYMRYESRHITHSLRGGRKQ